jgi:hypothetical protein
MRRTGKTRFPLERVRSVLAEFIAASGGMFTLQRATWTVNGTLNGSYDLYDHGTDGQVRRSLELLVRDCMLTKVGLRETGPDGRKNYTRQPSFYTPEAYAKAEADHDENERARLAVRTRWESIYDSLSAMDIYPVTGRGQAVGLSSATWDILLGRLASRD